MLMLPGKCWCCRHSSIKWWPEGLRGSSGHWWESKLVYLLRTWSGCSICVRNLYDGCWSICCCIWPRTDQLFCTEILVSQLVWKIALLLSIECISNVLHATTSLSLKLECAAHHVLNWKTLCSLLRLSCINFAVWGITHLCLLLCAT